MTWSDVRDLRSHPLLRLALTLLLLSPPLSPPCHTTHPSPATVNFAKKVVAARKALVQQAASPSLPPPEFEEAVVLLFGGGADGSAVNVLRKQRKPTLWKISNAM